ncbi:MAG TPA: ClpXP protease specificity-enhancing factor [Nevskiaceae bacterium]|nr:ClpXP protease specificity-enhancing factor [Nevskiaceae bacterium]
MSSRSRRPYLIRAIYEWALDNGFTPHLLVAADEAGVAVPQAYVQDGRIALNVAPMAVQGFDPSCDPLLFSARFGGHSFELEVPTRAVLAIYARENGEGISFGVPEGTAAIPDPDAPQPTPTPTPTSPDAAPGAPARPHGRPKLRVVK